MFKLFTTYFNSGHAGRQSEVDFCLQANLDSFDQVYVYADGAERPNWFGGYWMTHTRKKIEEVLAAARANAAPGDVVVLANSDIIFTGATLRQIDSALQPNQIYCLSRWDFVPGKGCILFDKDCSQDSWVFRGPPKENIGGDYHFGLPGGENRFAHDLDAAGYQVLNPSRDVKSYHPHVSGLRLSNKKEWRIPLPYLHIQPAHLGEVPTYRRPDKASNRAGCFQV